MLPAWEWMRRYRRSDLPADLAAGLITAVLLVPQGMAFAALAGVPPSMGLYASILPPVVYALFGTSRTLSVGPVSITALLVANAVAGLGPQPGSDAYLAAVLMLTGLSAAIFLAMGLLRLGALVHFISHPVLSGFTSAAAVIIVLSQMRALTGVPVPRGLPPYDTALVLARQLDAVNPPTLVLGLASIAALALSRTPLRRLLRRLGLSALAATGVARSGPLLILAAATAAVTWTGLDQSGVAVVGTIRAGLPPLSLGFLGAAPAAALLPSAVLISLIGYVQSISVAKVLAHRRRQRVEPNRELGALGLANAMAAVGGGMPVAGGFSRSMVNFDAGARTQLATLISAVLVAVAALLLTPLFAHLPRATLAAVIVVAVASLFDWREAVTTWRYDRGDFLALAVTFFGVLGEGLEWGLLTGVGVALAIQLWRSGHPHVAVVGRVPGTEHFRNIRRHDVETWSDVLLLRIDESLFFANASLLEDVIGDALSDYPHARHLVLICSAVNRIDYSALETLEGLNDDLREAGVTLHLAEVKGPVMDRLADTDLCRRFHGRIFLSTEEAIRSLADRPAR